MQATLNGCKLFYLNEENFQELQNEIFRGNAYRFESDKKAPLIIDCGSNIGMSIIYFKNKFPFAKIIGFEPDPNSYAILKKNVAVNEFKDITLINAALSNIEGETDFFGEFNGESPNSLGGSIIQAWGDRGYTEKIRVKAVKLSNFITTEVDFLKLDVEGAELHVLEELGDKLTFIREMSLEVHSSNQEVTMGKINKVTSLLKKYNFSFNVVCKNIACLLPEKQHPWIKKITPHLHIISAKRAN